MHLNTRQRVREDQQRMCAMHTHTHAVTNALTTTTTTHIVSDGNVSSQTHGAWQVCDGRVKQRQNQNEVPSFRLEFVVR